MCVSNLMITQKCHHKKVAFHTRFRRETFTLNQKPDKNSPRINGKIRSSSRKRKSHYYYELWTLNKWPRCLPHLHRSVTVGLLRSQPPSSSDIVPLQYDFRNSFQSRSRPNDKKKDVAIRNRKTLIQTPDSSCNRRTRSGLPNSPNSH